MSAYIIKSVHMYISFLVENAITLCHWLTSKRDFCLAFGYLIGSFLPRRDSDRRMHACPRPQIVESSMCVRICV